MAENFSQAMHEKQHAQCVLTNDSSGNECSQHLLEPASMPFSKTLQFQSLSVI